MPFVQDSLLETASCANTAAPIAPAIWGSALLAFLIRMPSNFSRVETTPLFLATPPVINTSFSGLTEFASIATRLAMAILIPAPIFSMGSPEFKYLMTSACAHTVHVEESVIGDLDFPDSGPSSLISSPKTFAMTSRKRPVPDAHLSLAAKRSTWPSEFNFMALQSWPPISITVRADGRSQRAPLPWQEISDTALSANSIFSRP